MEHSVELINPHGRRVQVVKAREAILLKQGYAKPDVAKPAPDPQPAKKAKPAPAKAETPKDEPPKGEEPPKGGDDGADDDGGLTLDELGKELEQLTKPQIAEYALENFSLTLDPGKMNKSAMIEKTLEAAQATLEQ